MTRRFKPVSFLSSGLASTGAPSAAAADRDHEFARSIGTALEVFAASGGTLVQAERALLRYAAQTALFQQRRLEPFVASARTAYQAEQSALAAKGKARG